MKIPNALSILGLTLIVSCILVPVPAGLESVKLTPGDGAAIVPGQPTAVLTVGEYPLPTDLLACVHSSIVEAAPDFPMLDAEQFRNAVFPWFEASVVPMQKDALAAILSKPAVRERIDGLSARYLVLVADIKSFTGDIEGPWGPQVMLPAGVGWMEERAQMVASIWDLEDASPVGTLAVTASGEAMTATWVGATLVAVR